MTKTRFHPYCRQYIILNETWLRKHLPGEDKPDKSNEKARKYYGMNSTWVFLAITAKFNSQPSDKASRDGTHLGKI